ncbi:EamA family transporter RarD [Neomegalonema perideroedes]|uniref:EamA family transporter RarD n=1 Tax=Neomegalonema perideroedes TaxID=217219 RepID=UPI0004777B3B|nr:EamA family transporter RarD [Neomegalonema perideroedes]
MSKFGPFLYAIVAVACWGLSPLLYHALEHVPAGEIVAHRGLWGGLILFGIGIFTGRIPQIREAMGKPKLMGLIAVAAFLVSINWIGFVWAVQVGRTAESSFGYYIYPLIAAGAGYVLLGERFSRLQAVALALAGAAVLALAAAGDGVPWLALYLAITFVAYGFLRKLTPVGPMAGTILEMAIVAPFAIFWLAKVSGGVFVTGDWSDRALLIFAGLVTGAPLALFATATKRLPYSTIGILFYLNPTLQFLCSLYFGEPADAGRLAAFAVIWTAVGLYCFDLWRQGRRPAPDQVNL